jgi:hypothetical protein
MLGCKNTVQMLLYRGYMALPPLPVKPWVSLIDKGFQFAGLQHKEESSQILGQTSNLMSGWELTFSVISPRFHWVSHEFRTPDWFFHYYHNELLHLTSRPLSLEIREFENEEIPTTIPRDYTYSIVDSYVTHILRIHDKRLWYQPNATNGMGDCIWQISALTTRAVFPSFFNPELRRGPFAFTQTDLHQSNILCWCW